ncbi:hypothetical protein PVAND_002144 [Polypedilum vanderplanki]|uniref:Exonuclease 1 n=1 Tax=Polypedilum vanderplanki TaxID=319348 RepID=A0A9J6BQ43_POLVA|nr:hypothetical protein PVAND_002144 [Polypedilum vanderplanki]
MGITGLIKFVDDAITTSRISTLNGSTVAVDSYYLLHKGSYSCADRLVQGIKSTAMISYAMKYVRMLLSHRISIVMVFDGKNLKAKALTEKRRREDRESAKTKATELLRAGKVEEARKEFTKAVNITHDHALELMAECRKLGVDCIVAMYEADAQLAYLNKIGIVQYVISEDSDLILFGCKNIVYKLSLDESCQIYDSNRLHLAMKKPKDKFSFETFRRLCILSGCDYIDSLPGIGLVKASKFFDMTNETDMKIALYRVPSYLKLKKANVTPEYVDNFLIAEATFKYMYVFDPIKKEMVRLNEIENEDDLKYCVNAGELLDKETAYQLALGNLNPRTMEKVNDYDPFKHTFTRKSIWRTTNIATNNDKSMPSTIQKRIPSMFLNTKPKAEVKPEVYKIFKEETNMEEILIDELVQSYTNNLQEKSENNAKKRSRLDSLKTEDKPSVSSHNPFAKKIKYDKNQDDLNDSSLKGEDAHNLSLLGNIKEKINAQSPENTVQKSRFFQEFVSSHHVPKDIILENYLDNTDDNIPIITEQKEPDEINPNEFIFFPEQIEIGDGKNYKYDSCTQSFRSKVKESPKKIVLAFDKWRSKYENKKIDDEKNNKKVSNPKSKTEGPKPIVLAFDKWKTKYENKKQSNWQK